MKNKKYLLTFLALAFLPFNGAFACGGCGCSCECQADKCFEEEFEATDEECLMPPQTEEMQKPDYSSKAPVPQENPSIQPENSNIKDLNIKPENSNYEELKKSEQIKKTEEPAFKEVQSQEIQKYEAQTPEFKPNNQNSVKLPNYYPGLW